MIQRSILENLYLEQGKSMQEIAENLKCSLHKVQYWMDEYKIKSRSRSEAIYLKHNPDGDPFVINKAKSRADSKLLGLGMGLYWGEGTKADKSSVRLGNSDPDLIRIFINFLIRFYSIDKEDLHFGLQIFNDISPVEALRFWCQNLAVNKSQFQKVIITPSRGKGNYKNKAKYGVLTVYYNNKKLRDIIINELKKLKP